MGYNTQFFFAPETISTARDAGYTKIETSSKTRRFGHFWPFSWAIAHNLFAPETISAACDSGYMLIGKLLKPVDLVISIRFYGL